MTWGYRTRMGWRRSVIFSSVLSATLLVTSLPACAGEDMGKGPSPPTDDQLDAVEYGMIYGVVTAAALTAMRYGLKGGPVQFVIVGNIVVNVTEIVIYAIGISNGSRLRQDGKAKLQPL